MFFKEINIQATYMRRALEKLHISLCVQTAEFTLTGARGFIYWWHYLTDSWEPHVGTGEGPMGAFSSSCTFRKPLLQVWALLPEKICAPNPISSLLKSYTGTPYWQNINHISVSSSEGNRPKGAWNWSWLSCCTYPHRVKQ